MNPRASRIRLIYGYSVDSELLSGIDMAKLSLLI